MTAFGIPAELIIFGVTLTGVAALHRQALPVALCGLAAAIAYKLLLFGPADGVSWLLTHVGHEWATLLNLLLLLVGFAVLANQFEQSSIPDALAQLLPPGFAGALILLALVFALSIFLDNIAAAIIGGVIAKHVYQGRVAVGYAASIVAASNAGGAGSVIGDTTTTMMWISGISPVAVLAAFIASCAAFAVFAPFSARQQHRFAPGTRTADAGAPIRIEWARVVIVLIMLGAILGVNLVGNAYAPATLAAVPALGIGLWAAIFLTSLVRPPHWTVIPAAAKGAVFLIALVALASIMPIEKLPAASWLSTFGLGVVSAVFDNIPLTALALRQGGYDWSLLAFAVGFGGSMVWFGSSAGVALASLYPEIRSVGAWVRQAWYVPCAYVVGFFALLWTRGWQPS